MNHKENFENAITKMVETLRDELKKNYEPYFKGTIKVTDPRLKILFDHLDFAQTEQNEMNLGLVLEYANAWLNRKDLFSDVKE
jgi:hypothetical protein